MRIEQPRIIIESDELVLEKIDKVARRARTCYASEPKNNESEFVAKLIQKGHTSVADHEKITVTFHTDIGISHEIVRHRIGAYCQQSSRYCNYSKDKFGTEVAFIQPILDNDEQYMAWEQACLSSEHNYFNLIDVGKTDLARQALNKSTKTIIDVTYDITSWRNFFMKRAQKEAHVEIQRLAIPLLKQFQRVYPCFFGDIKYNESLDEKYYASIELVDY